MLITVVIPRSGDQVPSLSEVAKLTGYSIERFDSSFGVQPLASKEWRHDFVSGIPKPGRWVDAPKWVARVEVP